MKKLLFLFFTSLILGACSLPGTGSSSVNHVCADKVIQEISTNKAVSGTWACLNADFQTMLKSYGLSADDNVFTLPDLNNSFPTITFQYVGNSYDMDLYVAKITDQGSPPRTLSVAVWVDKDNKVTNFGVGHPLFS